MAISPISPSRSSAASAGRATKARLALHREEDLITARFLIEYSRVKRHPADNAESGVGVPQAAPAEQDGDSSWERVLAFVAELRGSFSTGDLHETIARRLPSILGVDQLWIETTIGGRRKMIAAPVTGEPPSLHPLMEAAGEWATFPLRSGDTVVGVMGVPVTNRPLSPTSKRALALLAPLLGDSLQTAHIIAQLRELSTIDSVTGCATRPDGLERLRAELKRAHRASQQVAVLMLDLDYFKSINDRYGHQCGDSVLAAIGHTLMQTLRVSDLRCRWGGEEFLVALPESGLDQAKRVAVTLSRKIAGTVTECESARIQLTTSVGITIALPGGDLAEEPSTTRLGARDPEQPDRRQYRGPGRRATDFAGAGRPESTDVSGVDEARVRAILV